MTTTAALAGLAAFFWRHTVPTEAQERVRWAVAVTLGSIVGGMAEPKMCDLVRLTMRLPHEPPARVTVHCRSGGSTTAKVGVNRGDGVLAYTRADLSVKLLKLAGRLWPSTHCERLLRARLALGCGKSMLHWAALVREPPRQ